MPALPLKAKPAKVATLEEAFGHVAGLIRASRHRLWLAANSELIDLYWAIGRYLERKCAQEGWGQGTVQQLAGLIQSREPAWRGFSASNLWRMKQFAETYRKESKLATLLRELPWSCHLSILGKCQTMEEREFYIALAIRERWKVRELARQIDGSLFERVLGGGKPQISAVLQNRAQDAAQFFKDRYLVEFLDLPPAHSEQDLRKGLVGHLRQFLLELGHDFCFIAEEYPVHVGRRDFFLDLLFCHRALNCLVAFELKIGEFQPEHLGKLEFYLVALDRDHRKGHENPSVGVLLCKSRDRDVVEYALSRTLSPALVAEYQLRLPAKELIQSKMEEFSAMLQENGEEVEA
jgi:predicted nuclease of restriction endonuclease-like (RecB) superfamily